MTGANPDDAASERPRGLPRPDLGETRRRAAAALRAGMVFLDRLGPILGLFVLPLFMIATAMLLSRIPAAKHDVPLARGMTVEQVGRARPGNYAREARFDELPSARGAVRDGWSGFAGELVVRTAGGEEATFPFVAGRRSSFPAPPAIRPNLLKRIPRGTSLGAAVRKLGSGDEARLRPWNRSTVDYVLPADAPELTRFTGELTSHEVVSSWWILSSIDLYRWTTTFRNGRVVEVIESKVEVD